MEIAAFAFDYDGTLARDGRVAETTVAALRRLKAAGPLLLLITGRQLPDLQRTFSHWSMFDAIVAENGAVLLRPSHHEELSLAPSPPAALLEALRQRQVDPLSVGRSIIATWQPNETKVLAAIRDCGLEWQIIFNKGAVMCLPPGVNKASGLRAALESLGLSPLNVVGVGDAENDHAILLACGYRVAVGNAIDLLKSEADYVCHAHHGAGVEELIQRFLAVPPQDLTSGVRRYDLGIGGDLDGPVAIPSSAALLIAGSSGGGKSRLATLLIERIAEKEMQLCVVDPEAEYGAMLSLASLGGASKAPSLEEVGQLLEHPHNNLVINLLAVDLESRPKYVAGLITLLKKLKTRFARPHWLIIDEAHHGIPRASQPGSAMGPSSLRGAALITAAPLELPPAILRAIDVAIFLGEGARERFEACRDALGTAGIPPGKTRLEPNQALYWCRNAHQIRIVELDAPRQEHERHVRKYAQGVLGEDNSFYFRGEHNQLNLRAYNLITFVQLAKGVDAGTWLFHLQRGDYSRWFREVIKDEQLAEHAASLEHSQSTDATASRQAICDLVEARYTAPADAPLQPRGT